MNVPIWALLGATKADLLKVKRMMRAMQSANVPHDTIAIAVERGLVESHSQRGRILQQRYENAQRRRALHGATPLDLNGRVHTPNY